MTNEKDEILLTDDTDINLIEGPAQGDTATLEKAETTTIEKTDEEPLNTSRVGRFAGLGIIGVTTLAALLFLVVLVITEPRPFWSPEHTEILGFGVRYDNNIPVLGLLIAAVLLAVAAAVGVSLHENRVITRSRRTDPSVDTRPLAPRRVMERTRGEFAGEVTITAVIPAHNEEDHIPATLASLKEQTMPPERIVVVADNCTDDTVLLPDMGENDTVLVMDADTRLASDTFLETARRRMTDDRAIMAIGGLFNGERGPGLLRQFQRNEFVRYEREIQRRRGKVFVLTGTASVFRATALRTVAEERGTLIPGNTGEVYDTVALTEDNEITIAIKSLGGLIESPRDCQVTTELMPTWKMLWKQRLRWQRGAIENLSAYGFTPTTTRYWSQQIGIGYSVIALTSYFVLMAVFLLAIDEWIWYTFWIGLGLVFMLERVVTVWAGGWKARILALFVIPELIYDLYIDVVFVKGVIDMTFRREAKWSHVENDRPSEEKAELA